MTDEETINARKDSAFYCPGCGRGYGYAAECTGSSVQAPHPPIQTVPTDELAGTDEHPHGDPAAHTAAPGSE